MAYADDLADLELNSIKNNADELHICDGEPADYADIASHSRGHADMTSTDYTVGDGDTSGRKISIGDTVVTPASTGNVDHLVYADTSNSVIKFVNHITAKTVSSGVAETIVGYDLLEIRDPTDE